MYRIIIAAHVKFYVLICVWYRRHHLVMYVQSFPFLCAALQISHTVFWASGTVLQYKPFLNGYLCTTMGAHCRVKWSHLSKWIFSGMSGIETVLVLIHREYNKSSLSIENSHYNKQAGGKVKWCLQRHCSSVEVYCLTTVSFTDGSGSPLTKNNKKTEEVFRNYSK